MIQTATPAADERVARIGRFMQNFSLEAVRLSGVEVEALRTIVPAGTAVYVTALPHVEASGQIEACRQLRDAGLEPVPHVVARAVSSAAMLDETLARFRESAGARSALVIAGDLDHVDGPFASALDVIESGLLQRNGFTGIGISGYPGGHPRIGRETLELSRAAKIESAEQTGLAVHIVTQFAFENAAIINWIAKLRDFGIELPVRIGMAGPTNLARLLRYAQRCGVRASTQGLTRNAGLVRHLFSTTAPDALIRQIAEAQTQAGLGDIAAHFYSFGGTVSTARWARAVCEGRITPDRSDGFSVEP